MNPSLRNSREWLLLLIGLLVAIVDIRAIEIASTPTKKLWTLDGFAQVIKEADGVVYVGGRFQRAGQWTGGASLASPDTGGVIADFPKVNGVVSAAVSDGSGGYFIGGEFTEVGGIKRTNLAHITAQRQVDANWNPNPGRLIRGLSLYNGVLYFIGGSVNDYGSSTVTKLGAVQASNGVLLPFSVTITGTVSTILAVNDRVYVGGLFTQSNTSQAYNLAAYDLNGQITSWNPKVNEEVRMLAVSGNTLYASGLFSASGGKPRSGLAAIDLTTGATLDFDPVTNLQTSVTVIAVKDGTLYVAGSFDSIANQPRQNFAAFDIATGTLLPIQAEAVAYYPGAMAVGDDYIVIGGNPGLGYNYKTDRLFVLLDRQTGALKSTEVDPNLTVITALASNSEFLIGGIFSMVKGEERIGAAAFNAQTGELTPWNPRVESNVVALAIAPDRVFIGGELGTIGGQPRKNIGAVDRTTGALIEDWRADADLGVIDMAVYNQTLYVGGIFRSIGGQSRTNLAALDINTGAVSDWDPQVNRAGIRAMAISGDMLYIGGLFRSVFSGAITRNRLASFNLLTGELTTWNPNGSGAVEDIELAGDRIYVGGRFNSIGGQNRTNAAALSIAGDVLAWAPNPDGNVNDIAAVGDKVFLTGEFRNIDKQARDCLAAVDLDGHALPWNPRIEFFGYCLTPVADQLFVGGAFYEISEEIRMGFASYVLFDAQPVAPEISRGTVTVSANGVVTFDFPSAGGTTFTPQYSEDLQTWIDLPAITSADGATTVGDDSAGLRGKTFYRLKLGN